MLGKRPLNFDDYWMMLRRRIWLIVIPILLAPLVGYLVSYAFAAKYTSQALVLVEGQKVPEGYVKPVVTEDLSQRIATLQQQVLSPGRLRPMVERLGLAKSEKDVDNVIETIQGNLDIEPVLPPTVSSPSTTSTSTGKKKKAKANPSNTSAVPGFYVNYTANGPRKAQQICSALTSMFLEENLKIREQLAQGTTDFLARQLGESKQNLDDLESRLAAFKKQYLGQLPGDQDGNLKILMALNTQFEAGAQTLDRARQDKAYAETLLTQQLAIWRTSRASTNPQTIEQQLAAAQTQLLSLETRYTDDHPDVIKTKGDIEELKRKLDELNAAPAQNVSAQNAEPNPQGSSAEPPEIRQLRAQIHQYGNVIEQATAEQKRIQSQIAVYQGRVAISPTIEEQYKSLTRDYSTAQGAYNDLLAKKGQSEMQTDMERSQQGEQMRLLNPANLPDSPSFPTRWMFAAGGLAVGLGLGFGLALLMEFLDTSVRTERDAEAALALPMLVALPLVPVEAGGGSSRR
jgi:polysaccharide chain length determinant protein (PEP-CTERM system associated)